MVEEIIGEGKCRGEVRGDEDKGITDHFPLNNLATLMHAFTLSG